MCNLSLNISEKAYDEGMLAGRTAGREEGFVSGRNEGQEHERLSNIRNLMKNTGATAEKAMEMLGIDKVSMAKYMTLL